MVASAIVMVPRKIVIGHLLHLMISPAVSVVVRVYTDRHPYRPVRYRAGPPHAQRAVAFHQSGGLLAGEEWHLDHNPDRDGYLGPSHARCNLSAAAAVTNGRRPLPPFEEKPYRWSRRWFDDPPVGTIA